MQETIGAGRRCGEFVFDNGAGQYRHGCRQITTKTPLIERSWESTLDNDHRFTLRGASGVRVGIIELRRWVHLPQVRVF